MWEAYVRSPEAGKRLQTTSSFDFLAFTPIGPSPSVARNLMNYVYLQIPSVQKRRDSRVQRPKVFFSFHRSFATMLRPPLAPPRKTVIATVPHSLFEQSSWQRALKIANCFSAEPVQTISAAVLDSVAFQTVDVSSIPIQSKLAAATALRRSVRCIFTFCWFADSAVDGICSAKKACPESSNRPPCVGIGISVQENSGENLPKFVLTLWVRLDSQTPPSMKILRFDSHFNIK